MSNATSSWPKQATDIVDGVVDTVRDRVVRPAMLGARALVFGIIVGVVGLVFGVLASVGLIRLLDVYAFPGRVWASYAVLGAIFSVAGLVAWSKRGTRRADRTSGSR